MRTSLLAFFGCLLSLALPAQTYWQFVPEKDLNIPAHATRHIVPERLSAFRMNYSGLVNALKSAPMENSAGTPLLLELPAADGRSRFFEVWESPLTEPSPFAAPSETRTWAGRSADGYRVRMGAGPRGFHAFILSPDGSIETIRPYAGGLTEAYMVYDAKDLVLTGPNVQTPFVCGADDHAAAELLPEARLSPGVTDRGNSPVKLKIYRIAIAAMGEYSTFHGGTKPLVDNAIKEALNYINLILERDFAVRLLLIANNNDIIFLDAATDPFTGNQTSGFMNQNPAAINPIIGSDNYDIGHVFGVYVPGNTATGVAIRSSTCTMNKARGCSTAPQPNNEYFYKVAAHEICHQLSGTHTWNNCTVDVVDQRSLETVFEPGSGSSLMGYAGACGSNNVLADNEPYFHLANIIQVQEFIAAGNGSTCGTQEDTDNNTPSANIPLSDDLFIPISTPFQLTGEGSDPDGDQVRYCWEQWDRDTIGIPVILGVAAPDGALFRSFLPTQNPKRIFPRLSLLVANQTDKAEVLPNVNRWLSFRLSVRDYHPGGGGIAWDEVKFRSTSLAGPFTVTTPNSLADIWTSGAYETVVWDVANTNQAPVNCKIVNIRLSLDGGQTYPILLAEGVPNNGKACVRMPDNLNTNLARMWIEAADNIFFDISNATFNIRPATQPSFSLCTAQVIDTVCLPASYTATISTSALLGFSDALNLSASTNVAGALISFNNSAITPGNDAVMTIQFPNGQPEGDFAVVVKGTSGSQTDSVLINLRVVGNDFSALAPLSPLDGAVGQDPAAMLRWVKVADANTYDIQVASNPSFDAASLIAFIENTALDSFKIPVIQPKGKVIYWRVRPKNECGTGDWFGPYAYATVVDVCQTYQSTDVPKNISANAAVTVESKITVPPGGIVSDVNITRIQGNHTFFRELEMRLISPAGTDVLLFNNKCAAFSGNFNFGFDDSKLGLFGCPPPNNGTTSQPTEPLSSINGQNAGGDWILRVKDNSPGSGGQITGFALELCSSASLNPPQLVTNNQMQVEPGKNKAVTNDLLRTTDANNSDNQLLYTLTTIPKYGELQFNFGGKLLPGAQFTQADLNNGAIRYFDYGFSGKQDQFCFTVTDGEGGLISDCFVIQPFPLVNTGEPGRTIGFLMAPNPATDRVRLAFDAPAGSDTRVRFFDAAGRLVRDGILAAGQTTMEINVAHLPEGMYTVSVENAQGAGVRKVVVR